MNILPLLVVAVAVLPFVGLAVWVWVVTARTQKDLDSFGFEGMHFEE
jgi:nitrogen fixation-related uncharacterized protein